MSYCSLHFLFLPLPDAGKVQAAKTARSQVYNWGEYIDPDTITMFEEENRYQGCL